ncbi:hypothetical protein YC2023_035824 [Brassica napus]
MENLEWYDLYDVFPANEDKYETDEEHLGKLKSQIKGKESEIHSLKKKLDCLVAENSKLEERIMSVSSLEFTFRAASRSVHDFAKPLITLMKATVETIFGNVTYAKNSDKKVYFESYIVRRILSHPCDVIKLMSFDDPLDTLTAFPDSAVRSISYLFIRLWRLPSLGTWI